MEKLKNIIRSAYEWLNKEGGLLHILACYALMLTFAPFVGIGWASVVTWTIAFAKEVIDLIRKSNNLEQALNDVIRDAIGWGCGVIVGLLQTL